MRQLGAESHIVDMLELRCGADADVYDAADAAVRSCIFLCVLSVSCPFVLVSTCAPLVVFIFM